MIIMKPKKNTSKDLEYVYIKVNLKNVPFFRQVGG